MSEALIQRNASREALGQPASPASDVWPGGAGPRSAGRDSFALAAFLARWSPSARHDLSASDSQTLPVQALLRLADAEDRRRWKGLSLSYADPRGAPWLRTAVAARHASLSADDVMCCAGAQEAVACVARALLTPDDHAVVVLPIYQPSEQAVTALCPATGVVLEGRDWHLDLDRVAAALRPNTRLILTNFPNSPTGAALDAGTLAGLVALCRARGLWLVNDEVYRETECAGATRAPMVADAYERGVSINGLSKGFGLPGLRVGWAACRDRGLLARVLTAKSMLSSCLASPSEVLAHVALKAEARIIRRRREIGRRNHRRLRALVEAAPGVLEVEAPRNLAFAFPRYLGGEGADRFAATLVREAGLLVLPSSLWHSPLADVPTDRLRLGLGHASSGECLAALEDYLRAGRTRARVA